MELAPPTALEGLPCDLSFCESSVLCSCDVQASQDSCKLQVNGHSSWGAWAWLYLWGRLGVPWRIPRSVTVRAKELGCTGGGEGAWVLLLPLQVDFSVKLGISLFWGYPAHPS